MQASKVAQPDEEYHEPITQIQGIPIKVKHTPARLAHDILVHNELTKYTQVGVIGLPGSGKSTFVQSLVHTLHIKDPSYKVYHFKKEDILELDKILDKKIPKRQNCVLVFDDISYLFEQLSEKEVANILHNLTIVREKLDPSKETRCICFLMFHYSFALIKGMRMSNFRLMCSIQDEEFENYRKILGYHNSKNIRDFVRKYLSMMRYRNFRIASNTDEPFVYKTDQPFRLALISNLGELHYTLYHRASCELCRVKQSEEISAPPNASFWDDIIQTYDFSPVWNVLSKYAWMMTQKGGVDNQFAAIWRHIDAEYKAGHVDLMAIIKTFKEARHKKGKTPQETSQLRREFVIGKLKEMESKNIDPAKLAADSIANVPPEKLEGDEDKLSFEESEFILPQDEDDELEKELEDEE